MRKTNILPVLDIPDPVIPKSIEDYNFPTSTKQLLSWLFVDERMLGSKYYWITTTNRLGVPHSVPVWGIWYKNRIFTGGSPKTKWIQNLKVNPSVSVHLPSPEQVCIIEGKAVVMADDDIRDEVWDYLDNSYKEKYGLFHGSPYIFVEPSKVMAWNSDKLDNMTIWKFNPT